MKKLCWVLSAVLLYVAVIVPFTAYMQQKPFVEKLGYIPSAETLRITSLDQQCLVGAALVMKVLFYYGSIYEAHQKQVKLPPDYEGMLHTVETAIRLDPYNMDGYYFAQAILSWDLKRIERANEILEHGMKYRDWDFYLPFYAGFNSAYFLKDYKKAAAYYRRAADLTGYELFSNLAGRYMYESGRTDLAIAYLKTMIEGARDEAIRQTFRVRLRSLEEVRRIEQAREQFALQKGRNPKTLEELVAQGLLLPPPVDPYGGKFYLDVDQQVRTTSQFSYAGAQRQQ